MGSPFASMSASEPIPLPFDEGQSIVVRKMTGREHEQAQTAHRGSFASGSARAWSATLRRALEHGATDPEVLKALRDPLTGYDLHATIRAGLVSWTYPGLINKVEPKPEEYDAIRDLDDEALEFIAREVLKRTKPALFSVSDDPEAERKNG